MPAGRPVRRPRHRAADRGALAGPERPAGQHGPVPPARRGDDDRLRLAGACATRRSGRRSRRRGRSTSARSSSRRPARRALGPGRGGARWSLLGGRRRRARPERGSRCAGCSCPFGPDRWPQQTHLTLLDSETPAEGRAGRAVHAGRGRRPRASGCRPRPGRPTASTTARPSTESLRPVEGGIFRGRIEAVEPAVHVLGRGGRRRDVGPRRRREGRPAAGPQGPDRPARPARYTGLAPQTLAPGKTQIQAVEGTRVELEALANKPIASADAPPRRDAAAREPVDARRGADPARRRRSPLTESQPFWFELLDTEGFRNREAVRYDVRAVARRGPPGRRSTSRRTTATSRPRPTCPSRSRSTTTSASSRPGWSTRSPRAARSRPRRSSSRSGTTRANAPGGRPVKHQEVRYEWDLAPLKLAPGSIITFHADARDFDNLKGPNLGKSREIRLRIVSDEEIARQLDDARREIREEIDAHPRDAEAGPDPRRRRPPDPRARPTGSTSRDRDEPQERRDDPAPGRQPGHQQGRRPRPEDPPVPRRPQELQDPQPRRPEADGGDAGRRRADPRADTSTPPSRASPAPPRTSTTPRPARRPGDEAGRHAQTPSPRRANARRPAPKPQEAGRGRSEARPRRGEGRRPAKARRRPGESKAQPAASAEGRAQPAKPAEARDGRRGRPERRGQGVAGRGARRTRRRSPTSSRRCSTASASSRPTAASSRTPRTCSRSRSRR